MKRWLALLFAGAIFLGTLGCQAQLASRPILGTTAPQIPTEPTVSQTVPTQPPVGTTAPTTRPTTVPTLPPTVPTTQPTQPPQPTTQPTQPPQPTTPPPTEPAPDPSTLWVVNGYSYVNFRKDPRTDAAVLERLAEGTVVQLRYWTGKFACVEYNKQVGFVMSCYIKPAADDYMSNALDTVPVTDVYAYTQMLEDMVTLYERHPDQTELEIIGYSELGNQIPVLRIGSSDATHHVLIQGAIHGREHMTAWLIMALADYWLDQDPSALADVCYHLIPMSNPDGVIISQTGLLIPEHYDIYRQDLALGYTRLEERSYAAIWKANALGVDVNRNFDAGWDRINNRETPSSENHKGEAPFSSAEACVLRDYTLRYTFGATISYHAMGSVIYYAYGNKQPVNSLSSDLAKKVVNVTGYYMIGDDGTSHGGYKDWAMEVLEIPSLTIEIGCENTPLAKRELYSIFVRNRDVLPAIAQWLQK